MSDQKTNAFVPGEEPVRKRRKLCDYLISDKLLTYYSDYILPQTSNNSSVRENSYLPNYKARSLALHNDNSASKLEQYLFSERRTKYSMVGTFKKHEQIGEGTYGSVFRACSLQGMDVALKRIRCDDGIDYKCDLEARERDLIQKEADMNINNNNSNYNTHHFNHNHNHNRNLNLNDSNSNSSTNSNSNSNSNSAHSISEDNHDMDAGRSHHHNHNHDDDDDNSSDNAENDNDTENATIHGTNADHHNNNNHSTTLPDSTVSASASASAAAVVLRDSVFNTKEFEKFDFERGRMTVLKKKGFSDQIGCPHTAIQELSALQRLNHKNIVNLIDCVSNRNFSSIPVNISSKQYLALLIKQWKKTTHLQQKYTDIAIVSEQALLGLSAHDCITEITRVFSRLSASDVKYLENCIRYILYVGYSKHYQEKAKEGTKAPPLFFMIFEFMDRDLAYLINSHPSHFKNEAVLKYYFQQIMCGLQHCHECGIIHRDIKPNNVLINIFTGEIKLCDFGLAFSEYSTHSSTTKTSRVVTIWYRAPEILMGDVTYGPAIDIWSIACIFVEMQLQNALFQGRNELDQFHQICSLCAVPTEENYARCSALPWYPKLLHLLPKPLPTTNKILTDPYLRYQCSSLNALKFAHFMLVLDPKQRPTCDDILLHPYLHTQPLPEHIQLDVDAK